MTMSDYQYRRVDGTVLEDVTITLDGERGKQRLELPKGLYCTVIVITDAAEMEKLWWKTGKTEL